MTVLENIPVLATGTDTEIKDKGRQEKAVEVDVITLEVTPDEAEVLALAASQGTLQLSLRNYTDTSNIASRGASVQSLMRLLSGKDSMPVKKTVHKKGAPEPERQYYSRVQVIEGHKVGEVTFKEGSE